MNGEKLLILTLLLITIVAFAIILIKIYKKKKKSHKNYDTAYKPKYILTLNEKRAFQTIKEVSEELGYTALTKVRLFDLIEPKEKNNKGAQYKIQAKHVDFVICDKSLIARYIIELSDSSHERTDRKERDEFVATILKNCGYKVLITKNIDKNSLKEWIKEQEN